MQAAATQLANAGATGNPKLLGKFLDLIEKIEARGEAARPSEYPLSEADLTVIREVHDRLWQYKALLGHIADIEIVHRVEGVGTDLKLRSHFAEAIGL